MLLWLVHALNYLYFFVDDEAIPYVYAQNLLHGKGVVYNTLEGRLEGYSDFLHVWLATIVLAIVRALHLPKLTVFFIGKAWSMACAAGIIVLAWAVLRRLRIERAAAMTGLAFLALAPPLAVWSCSSLETVPFALTLTVLLAALLFDADRWAAVAAILLVLERIDGFVYAAAFAGAFFVAADPARRRAMLTRIGVPLAVAFTAYHAWRGWYFGDLLPAPLESKILYKLQPHANLVMKAPDEAYLRAFAHVYGWPAAAATVLGALAAFRERGLPRTLLVALVPLFAYVAVVGDWMFGFRFFVALMPPLALFIATALHPIAIRRPRVVAALGIAAAIYLGCVAARFVDRFRLTENVETFLSAPSRDPRRFFWPYYDLYVAARKQIRPGEIIAYNQAGFIPYMLDVDNIDDLGICSRFYADLPTTDLYFTEVGRYAPLTNTRALRAGQAYLLYHNVRFVMSRTDILARANGNTIPRTLFGGYYELIGIDRDRQNAIYRRTDKPAGAYQTDPAAFVENVAHVSYVRAASVNGETIAPSRYQSQLQFLGDQTSEFRFTATLTIVVDFAPADEYVRAITFAGVRVSAPSTLRLALAARDGRLVSATRLQLAPGRATDIESAAPENATASRLLLDLTSASGEPVQVWLTEGRVLGQTPALERYIRTRLQFPAPPVFSGQ